MVGYDGSMKAAIYVRRSVADKDKKAASLQTQEQDCLVRAGELGYEPVVFTEELAITVAPAG
jgi:DNA invertase Pin-like site-specific DNA recombinase